MLTALRSAGAIDALTALVATENVLGGGTQHPGVNCGSLHRHTATVACDAWVCFERLRVILDGCFASPIVGVRYSKTGVDWDLCSGCFEALAEAERQGDVYETVALARDRGLIAAQVPAATALSHLFMHSGDGDDLERAQGACTYSGQSSCHSKSAGAEFIQKTHNGTHREDGPHTHGSRARHCHSDPFIPPPFLVR